MVAALIDIHDGEVTDARIALGAVSDRPVRATGAEEHLKGGPATRSAFVEAAELAAQGWNRWGTSMAPPSTVVTLVRALTRRALEQATGQ